MTIRELDSIDSELSINQSTPSCNALSHGVELDVQKTWHVGDDLWEIAGLLNTHPVIENHPNQNNKRRTMMMLYQIMRENNKRRDEVVEEDFTPDEITHEKHRMDWVEAQESPHLKEQPPRTYAPRRYNEALIWDFKAFDTKILFELLSYTSHV